MSRLDIAIAKEFNRQNPITKFDGMDDQEAKAFIRHSILNGYNKIWLIVEYKNFKQCTLIEAKRFVFHIIGELAEIFYTGLASTPTSVGVRLKDKREIVIVESELSHIESGAETREKYNAYVEDFKKDFGLV
jgi:hypothetical protein